jgi:hypothetical protein
MYYSYVICYILFILQSQYLRVQILHMFVYKSLNLSDNINTMVVRKRKYKVV